MTLSHLPDLEAAIWHAATHCDPAFMAGTLAPDSAAFGRRHFSPSPRALPPARARVGGDPGSSPG